MQLREDGIPSLLRSAIRHDVGPAQVQALLADLGFEWSLETVRKKLREVREEVLERHGFGRDETSARDGGR